MRSLCNHFLKIWLSLKRFSKFSNDWQQQKISGCFQCCTGTSGSHWLWCRNFLVVVVLFILGLIIKSAKSLLSEVAALVEEKDMRRQPFFPLDSRQNSMEIGKLSLKLSHIMKWPVILQWWCTGLPVLNFVFNSLEE